MLESVTPIIKVQYNIWDIVGAEIINSDEPRMISNLRNGYKDESGEITWYETEQIILSGEDLLTEWGKAPVGATIYESVIMAITAYLMRIGKIPVNATQCL